MLLRGGQVLHSRQQQFSRAIYQWRLQQTFNGIGHSALRSNECALLRLQARSRLGGGGGHACNNKWWLMPRRWSTSDGKDKMEPASVATADKASQIKKEELPGGTKTKFEVKTSKGILSITTTIEDSKINEIVFEKTELSPVAKLNEPALNLVASETIAPLSGPQSSVPLPVPPPIRIEAVETAAPTTQTAAPAPKRPRFDYRISLERNFVTPARAISDFMLSATDLEKLPKIKRRSPYEQEPPMTVYWRRDVEAKALEVWGSRDGIVRERLKRDLERKQYQQSKFTKA